MTLHLLETFFCLYLRPYEASLDVDFEELQKDHADGMIGTRGRFRRLSEGFRKVSWQFQMLFGGVSGCLQGYFRFYKG